MGRLMAVRFNLKSLKTVGQPIPVVENVSQANDDGGAPFVISSNGMLLYRPGGSWASRRRIVWVDRNGQVTPVKIEPDAYEDLALSPDGRQLALTVFRDGWENIHVHDLGIGTTTQLTFEGSNGGAVWGPDGREIIFSTIRDGPFDVYRVPVDQSQRPAPVITGNTDQQPFDCSPDGNVVLVDDSREIVAVTTHSESPPEVISPTRGRHEHVSFSPDGRWIAFTSNASGRREVYIAPYPGPGGIQQVSTAGGIRPLWSPRGDELFYYTGPAIMAAPIRTSNGDLAVGRPEQLVEHPSFLAGRTQSCWAYDARSDRFLIIEESDQEMWHDRVMVVTNWFEELKRLVPTE
jgi:Tol biopolymer transport system component